MTEKSLKKLLLTMLKDEYPQIKDIVVNSSELMGGDLGTSYNVGLGINYGDLMKMSDEDERLLKTKVRNLSKYLLGKKESLESSFFYDPN
jgi:hypothetical protein